MHCVKAIAVVISGICPAAMTDARMRIAPLLQTALDGVCIRVDTCARGNRRVDQRLDGLLLAIGQPTYDHFAPPLDHPADRWLLGYKCPAAALAFEPPTPAATPFFATSSGLPLCPATMETSSHSTMSCKVGVGFCATIP
jgi:hypothetical protein